MILLDSGEGSKLLIDYIKPAGLAQLVSGLPTDICFLINGPLGKVAVGIEHKRLQDALECIKTGRLTDVQVPKLKDKLDICLLMIETGIMRRNTESGLLEVRRGEMWQDTAEMGWGAKPWLYRDVMGWLWSVQFQGGVWLMPFVKDKVESGWLIANLYQWGQEAWDDHKSFKKMFIAGAPPSVNLPPMLFEAAGEISPFRYMMAALPHIGWEISAICEERWAGSIFEAANATESDWAELVIGRKGKQKRRLGKKYARDIINIIHAKKQPQ